MKRIFLFLVTNLAVLALLSVVIFVIGQFFGVHLRQGGMGGLLVFAAIFGFAGALISLALSKWTGARKSHVANGDMVTLALLQGVLNSFVIFLARIRRSISVLQRYSHRN